MTICLYIYVNQFERFTHIDCLVLFYFYFSVDRTISISDLSFYQLCVNMVSKMFYASNLIVKIENIKRKENLPKSLPLTYKTYYTKREIEKKIVEDIKHALNQ